MFDLEDSLTIESHKIPWLIWIQILIFFLLLFLLYCFSVFTSPELSLNTNKTSISSSSSASASPSISYLSKQPILKRQSSNFHTTTTLTNRLKQHHNQLAGSQSIKGEITSSSTSGAIVTEESTETEGISSVLHPCNYIRLAKLAFLKCFGLDPTTSEGCSSLSSSSSLSSDQKKER